MKSKANRNPQKVREANEFPKTPGYKTPAGAYEEDSPKRQMPQSKGKKDDPTKEV